MNTQNNTASGGIGCMVLLTILFIALKLTNVITWSWWLLLIPAYGLFALLFMFCAIALILGAIIK